MSQAPALFENSFTEKTTEQDKFVTYLDSIDKYLYRDTDLTNLALGECQNIIDRGTSLSDSILFEYVLAQIYFEYSMANPLGAYQIISDHEKILTTHNISKSQIGTFNYLKSFTYMSMGDLEAAQKSYYEQINLGELNKDTGIIIQGLYSLGQLYNDEEDFEASINCFKKIIDYSKVFNIRPSTMALTYIELSEGYIDTKKYDKTLEVLQQAFEILEEHDINVLKSDVLMLKGNVYLEQNKIDSAENIYQQLIKSSVGLKDQNNALNTQKFLAQLYRTKKMYPEALKVYNNILEKTDSSALDNILNTYNYAHEVCNEMKDFEAAYDYLLAYNKVKTKKEEDTKRQKTAYLKIKFDSEQKERDNLVLAAKVTKSKAERKLLYGGILLSCLFLIILFSAFYQKRRYSRKLETEVLKRTVNLQKSNSLLNKSNKELDEFNRILSHDLKEPLRSIVGFSQLVKRDLVADSKAQEYLAHVITSGQQLEQLIDDVRVFRSTNSINTQKMKTINIHQLFEETLQEVQKHYPNKQLLLACNTNLNIIGPNEILKPIFRSIIDNAAKYNEQELVSISINYSLEDQMHAFEIKDNGIGIAQKFQAQVFEMFKRLNNRTDYTGSGLGLSIAKKLIEKIDGDISILRSQENIGTTFSVRFPDKTISKNEKANLVVFN